MSNEFCKKNFWKIIAGIAILWSHSPLFVKWQVEKSVTSGWCYKSEKSRLNHWKRNNKFPRELSSKCERMVRGFPTLDFNRFLNETQVWVDERTTKERDTAKTRHIILNCCQLLFNCEYACMWKVSTESWVLKRFKFFPLCGSPFCVIGSWSFHLKKNSNWIYKLSAKENITNSF